MKQSEQIGNEIKTLNRRIGQLTRFNDIWNDFANDEKLRSAKRERAQKSSWLILVTSAEQEKEAREFFGS